MLVLWRAAEGERKDRAEISGEDSSRTLDVCLEAYLSDHSYEDKLIGLFHRKIGCLSLLPLAVPWSW